MTLIRSAGRAASTLGATHRPAPAAPRPFSMLRRSRLFMHFPPVTKRGRAASGKEGNARRRVALHGFLVDVDANTRLLRQRNEAVDNHLAVVTDDLLEHQIGRAHV